jgi:hypothetical protein
VARDEPIVRPARTDEWLVVAADKGVAEDWERWAKQEPNALAATYDKLATDPTAFSSRQRKLEGRSMGSGVYEGKTLERWQYEVTSGGRVFYLVDDPTDGGRRRPERKGRGPKPRRRVIIEAVHSGHPKQTERKRG